MQHRMMSGEPLVRRNGGRQEEEETSGSILPLSLVEYNTQMYESVNAPSSAALTSSQLASREWHSTSCGVEFLQHPSRALPDFHSGLVLASLHRLEIPQALRYLKRFFFSRVQPEIERKGGFLPVPGSGKGVHRQLAMKP